MKEFKKFQKQCCPNDSEILECVCELDQELECIKNLVCHNKSFSHVTKEKVLFCILLREIADVEKRLGKKLDKILRELDCDWCSDSDSDSDSKCD